MQWEVRDSVEREENTSHGNYDKNSFDQPQACSFVKVIVVKQVEKLKKLSTTLNGRTPRR